jgi:hypothetical protein
MRRDRNVPGCDGVCLGWEQEMEAMQGADVFGGFYNKLRDLREYHKKFPNLYYDQGPADTEVSLAHV